MTNDRPIMRALDHENINSISNSFVKQNYATVAAVMDDLHADTRTSDNVNGKTIKDNDCYN